MHASLQADKSGWSQGMMRRKTGHKAADHGITALPLKVGCRHQAFKVIERGQNNSSPFWQSIGNAQITQTAPSVGSQSGDPGA